MSEEMPSTSWRSIASAASSRFRSYIQREAGKPAQRGGGGAPILTVNTGLGPGPLDEKTTWRAWAGQKFRLRRAVSDEASGEETITLFPGWAARRYHKPGKGKGKDDLDAFEVEVYVSGFASNHRRPEQWSRYQRAAMRFAKGYASLPRLSPESQSPATELSPNLSPSTEALLAQVQLPPRPEVMTEDYIVKTLERQIRQARTPGQNDLLSPSSSRSSLLLDEDEPPKSDKTPHTRPSAGHRNNSIPLPADISRMHENLETRFRPFLSSVLPSRTIRLQLFASPHIPDHLLASKGRHHSSDEEYTMATQDVSTTADGSFQARFVVKWEDLCQHPHALHIAFGDRCEEHDLLVTAKLLPPPHRTPTPSTETYDEMQNYFSAAKKETDLSVPRCPTATLRISLTHSNIRVVSDIDDTVKLSEVFSGIRAVFHNVFVKELHDNIIPGMGEWYSEMWSRGARFHYVSNGPYELLPVLSEFFHISQLPPGSIKLKSYAGRSFFRGLLSAPAARKRANVLDVLDSFPESKFLLIGDSGEQDLELYADLARERPHQVLAVFIRDPDSTYEPIDDPTGWKSLACVSSIPEERERPRPRRTISDILASRKKTTSPTSPISPQSDGAIQSENQASSGHNNSLFFTSVVISEEPESMPVRTTSPECILNGTGNGASSAFVRSPPAMLEVLHPHFDQDSDRFNRRSATVPSPTSLIPPSLLTRRSEKLAPPSSSPAGSTKSRSSVSSGASGSSFGGAFGALLGGHGGSAGTGAGGVNGSVYSNGRANSGSYANGGSGIGIGVGSSSGSASASSSNGSRMNEVEKKRCTLQMRVHRARTQMPSHVVLRVFRDPKECVEVEGIFRTAEVET